MNSHRPKPVVLVILDGFGYNESSQYNAISAAKAPTWKHLWASCAHTTLDCAGETVGLPDDQMGNSEVGHLHLGAGRLINQDFTAVNKAVRDGSFFTNHALTQAVDLNGFNSLTESQIASGVSVYPNPFLDVFTIVYDCKDHFTVEVVNSVGQQMDFIELQKSGAGMFSIATLDWPQGIYLVKFNSDTSVWFQFLIKM